MESLRSLNQSFMIVGLLAAAACGGNGDDDANEDGGPGGADAEPGETCFDSDSYLPQEVGNTWSYKITDLVSGAVATKAQSVEDAITDPTFGPVTVQLTGKLNGSTRSLFKVEGDAILRVQQEDLDATGALEKTTVYDPGQLRIDQSADKLEMGAAWDDVYTNTETPVVGAMVVTEVVDHWEVLGVDVPCEGPIGAYECIRLKKTRTMGGTSVKEFFFARGVGKVRESGDNQLEELEACSTAR